SYRASRYTMEPWRLFIAIELPPHVRRTIKQHIEGLRQALPDVRASWTREESLHLTLKFLSNVAVDRVESLSQALRQAATRAPAFDLVIQGCGVFPPRGKPNVLWIGVSPESEAFCLQLYEAIEAECAAAGFAREQRMLHPHLTIARLRHPAGAHDLARMHEEVGFETLSLPVRD